MEQDTEKSGVEQSRFKATGCVCPREHGEDRPAECSSFFYSLEELQGISKNCGVLCWWCSIEIMIQKIKYAENELY